MSLGLKCSSVFSSVSPTSDVRAQEKIQCLMSANGFPGHENLQLAGEFLNVALTLSSVGSNSCTNFHEKDMVLLGRALR